MQKAHQWITTYPVLSEQTLEISQVTPQAAGSVTAQLKVVILRKKTLPTRATKRIWHNENILNCLHAEQTQMKRNVRKNIYLILDDTNSMLSSNESWMIQTQSSHQ